MKEPPSSCPTDARVPSSSGVSIVVPTYREAANLRAIARRVASVMSATGVPWELGLGVHVGGYALPTTFVEPFAQHAVRGLRRACSSRASDCPRQGPGGAVRRRAGSGDWRVGPETPENGISADVESAKHLYLSH